MGIPNHRRRCFMLCERSRRFDAVAEQILTTLPPEALSSPGTTATGSDDVSPPINMARAVGDFLLSSDELDDEARKALTVPRGVCSGCGARWSTRRSAGLSPPRRRSDTARDARAVRGLGGCSDPPCARAPAASKCQARPCTTSAGRWHDRPMHTGCVFHVVSILSMLLNDTTQTALS